MSKFALERIRAIEGNQTFEKLIINKQCQFDDFEEELRSDDKLFTELGKIYGYMEDVANGISLPSTNLKILLRLKN